MKDIDVICAGEILIDFIGHQSEKDISQTKDYHRYLGGSPTNVALNLTRLGMNVHLAATIGKDGFGNYVSEKLVENQVSRDGIRVDEVYPTSVIFVSKTGGTPDFVPYREADMMITENQFTDEIIRNAKIFHTTAFALSKNPARNTILAKAKEAHDNGSVLSIDLNFSDKIWKDRYKAIKYLTKFCEYDPLVKISEDDMDRLFEKRLTHDEIFTFFHDHLQVSTVCLTLGSKGVTLSRKQHEPISLPAEKVDTILDATGAGDAFWSGFLFAYAQDFVIERCLKIALSLAAIKLQNVGRLPQNIDLNSQLLNIT